MQGKSNKQNEDSALFAAIGVVGFFLTFVLLLITIHCSSQQTGYQVVIDNYAPTRKVDVVKTTDTTIVNNLFASACNLRSFSITSSMDNTRMFEARNEKVWVYCEERRIKTKKNGKVKYKKLRK